jgi:hypothetical protein
VPGQRPCAISGLVHFTIRTGLDAPRGRKGQARSRTLPAPPRTDVALGGVFKIMGVGHLLRSLPERPSLAVELRPVDQSNMAY